MDKSAYVVSGVGGDRQSSKSLGIVYDGAILHLTKETAREINTLADAYEKRNTERTALRVKRASKDVVAEIEADREIEEVASLAAARTPEDRVADLIDAHSRSELEAMATELGIEGPERRKKFANMAELAVAIVGADPT